MAPSISQRSVTAPHWNTISRKSTVSRHGNDLSDNDELSDEDDKDDQEASQIKAIRTNLLKLYGIMGHDIMEAFRRLRNKQLCLEKSSN